MMQINSFTIALCVVLFTIVVVAACHFASESQGSDITSVKATYDDKMYKVRDMPDRVEAANLLAKLCEVISRLNSKLGKHYPNDKRVKLLLSRYKAENVSELSSYAGSQYTAYSVGKGRRLVFCLRTRDNQEKLVRLQTLTFVAIHELAHVMSMSIGHTEEFWDNMRFLLANAIEWNLYKSVNYSKKPQAYCGLQITATPLPEGQVARSKYVTYDQSSTVEETFDNVRDANFF